MPKYMKCMCICTIIMDFHINFCIKPQTGNLSKLDNFPGPNGVRFGGVPLYVHITHQYMHTCIHKYVHVYMM